MLTYSVEESIDASAEDILEFLGREVQSLRPCKGRSDEPEEMDGTLHFMGERKGTSVSFYVKKCDTGERGDEIIRFEVIQRSGTMSVVKASYESNNSHFVFMFYNIWARLAIAFGASFAGEALRRMRDLQ